MLSSQALAELMRGTLTKGFSFRFTAKGISMAPFIKDGDVLTMHQQPDGQSLRPGLVVAFVNPQTERLAVHRVIGRSGPRYLIKGDNALENDGFIKKEDILGYVWKIERDGRRISFGLGSERGIILFLSRFNLLHGIISLWRIFPFSARKMLLRSLEFLLLVTRDN